jgi:hypothetical protein
MKVLHFFLKISIQLLAILMTFQKVKCQERYLPPSEFLSNTVIFISGYCDTLISGKPIRKATSGTGFFFQVRLGSDSVLCLVSNKHVVENMCNGLLTFTKADKDSMPIYGHKASLEIQNFKNKWIYSSKNDLAVLPISNVLNDFEKTFGSRAYLNYLTEEIIPTSQKVASFQFIEELLMIGYPKGIYDTTNNIPIFRKGFTATPYRFNFNGLELFLADLPDFEGSSGSPVFLYSEGSYSPSGKYFDELHESGLRVYLLGINMGTFFSNDLNRIFDVSSGQSKEIPAFSETKTYLDLGVIIKSEALLEFKTLLKNKGFNKKSP